MEFLALSFVVITIILTKYPPTFRFIKEIHVINPQNPQAQPEIVDISEVNAEKPPSLDELMETFNATIHEIIGGDTLAE